MWNVIWCCVRFKTKKKFGLIFSFSQFCVKQNKEVKTCSIYTNTNTLNQNKRTNRNKADPNDGRKNFIFFSFTFFDLFSVSLGILFSRIYLVVSHPHFIEFSLEKKHSNKQFRKWSSRRGRKWSKYKKNKNRRVKRKNFGTKKKLFQDLVHL